MVKAIGTDFEGGDAPRGTPLATVTVIIVVQVQCMIMAVTVEVLMHPLAITIE
jgi:hypothetical protein